jgi:hypothetical protein
MYITSGGTVLSLLSHSLGHFWGNSALLFIIMGSFPNGKASSSVWLAFHFYFLLSTTFIAWCWAHVYRTLCLWRRRQQDAGRNRGWMWDTWRQFMRAVLGDNAPGWGFPASIIWADRMSQTSWHIRSVPASYSWANSDGDWWNCSRSEWSKARYSPVTIVNGVSL